MTAAIQRAETQIATDFRDVLRLALEPYATRADLANLRAELFDRIADTKTELLCWMFVFWVGQLAGTVAVLRLLK